MKKLIYAFWIAIYCGCFSFAQNIPNSKNETVPPSAEKFEASGDLVVPWRDSGCFRLNFKFNEPGCHIVTAEEYKNSDKLSIYNEDGSLWHRFSLTYQKPDYFLRDKKMSFLPFSTGSVPGDPGLVILRMVGESAHWYEVEVNETTRATKFVLKSDPMWAKTTWSYWFYFGSNLKIDNQKVKLLDKPDGEIIEESANWSVNRVRFLKSEGDWAFVETVDGKKYQGWIRWRNGRNILVGCIFNAYKMSEATPEN
jgi:hypothetical protein